MEKRESISPTVKDMISGSEAAGSLSSESERMRPLLLTKKAHSMVEGSVMNAVAGATSVSRWNTSHTGKRVVSSQQPTATVARWTEQDPVS
jgi:hypothetical protein